MNPSLCLKWEDSIHLLTENIKETIFTWKKNTRGLREYHSRMVSKHEEGPGCIPQLTERKKKRQEDGWKTSFKIQPVIYIENSFIVNIKRVMRCSLSFENWDNMFNWQKVKIIKMLHAPCFMTMSRAVILFQMFPTVITLIDRQASSYLLITDYAGSELNGSVSKCWQDINFTTSAHKY